MDEKIASLEEEISGVKTTLATMERNQAKLIAMFEKSMGKSIHSEDENVAAKTMGEGSVQGGGRANTNQLEGEALVEFRGSVKKVELPMFDGDDPAGWISRAEVYFRVQNTRSEVKVNLAQLYMEAMEKAGDVYEQLTELQQRGSVDEYINDFEYLTAQIPRLPDKQFMGYFLHGLKEEIRGKVRSLTVMGELTRTKVLQLARTVERETRKDYVTGFSRSNKPGHGSNRTGPNGSSKTNGSDWVFVKNNKDQGVNGGTKNNGSGPKNERQAQYDRKRNTYRERGYAHLSYNELMERKQKGLSFKCGGAFHPMHQCPDKQLRVLIVDDEEEAEQGGKLLAVELEDEDEAAQGEMSTMEFQQLGFHGRSKPQVIKLKGTIHEVPVVILVDSGASHNFISQSLVQKMNWKTIDCPSMNIKLGDGSCARTKGVCEGLEIDMEGVEVVVDAQVFELGCVDVVLGIEWLRTLGDMIINWQKHTMNIWLNKEWVTLKGLEGEFGVMDTLHSVLAGWKNKVKCGSFQALEEGQSRDLEHLLNVCAEVFLEPTGLPPKRKKEHVITLKEGEGAVNVRPYRYPHHHKNEIERQVKEMLASGIIRPSTSSFSSPVILVKKKDNTWRMCIDYRALNKATVPDKFPIPVIEELLDELHGAKYFSKLDLKSGYHQVRVREEDIHKTVFRTHEGHYEFMVMPFGLMNAPSTFQSLMNEVFRSLLRKTVLVFFDDILVYSKSWSEHLKHVEEVLKILKLHGLVANKKKCQFGQRSVEYLGHLITGDGVAVDPNKVVSVTKWPTPKNVKGVRGFLGLTGYYRKFIKDYGKIARPLTDLTKKDAFVWNKDAQEAFDHLKSSLTTAPVLALPDFNKDFLIECDASGGGIGAILMQDKKPVAYFIKSLGVRNLTKSTYEKELMAIVLAIQHWRPYLLGRKFIVSTDQKSLKQLLQQRMVTADQQNWATKLLGYDFEIIYKPGNLNRGADALSRIHEGGELCQLVSRVQWKDEKLLRTEVQQDHQLQHVIQELQKDSNSWLGYEYKHGVLLYEGRLLLSAKSSMIPLLLTEFHATPQGGHSGFYRTYIRLAANVYWVGMKSTVQEFVKACDTCQRQKYLTSSPGGLLQPLPIPDRIWEDISIDFITGLPKSRGNEAILVIVDRLSKYAHFVPLKHPYTAKMIAEVFVREVVRLHGIPLSIVTDQPRTWANWISWAEYWFNTSYHASTGKTPYEIVYGRVPPVITRWVQGETRVEAVQKELVDRDEALRQLREQLLRAQDRMKQMADKKRCDRSFEVVVARVGAVAYKLKLPEGSWVHPVFHVSLLKKVVGTYHGEEELPELEGEKDTLIEPEEVLARRTVMVQNEEINQVLIHWKDQSIEEATWEDVVMIKSQFPSFCLEDKAVFSGGSIDRTHIQHKENDTSLIQHSSIGPKSWQVYSRRNKIAKS
ncbi:hypothetical protein TSUD_37270 [Trifolium subterraneum]|uniref:Ty3/gypsy retrotransposon protein n=1 Tax=Trifolium subterraneum TaxID=3900 RepID=A0A2Z6M4R0_TRISU|nr:hypothetical protein TSUD_37270 [Trifolium subterraneum]